MDCVEIKNLKVSYGKGNYEKEVLHGININAYTGKITAIIGESGSGKTTIGKTIQGILNENANVEGKIRINNIEYDLSNRGYKREARKKIASTVFQDAKLSLNPNQKIKKQITENYDTTDRSLSKKEYVKKVKVLMQEVGLFDIERILNSYPRQLSGGMCQKLVIIMSIIKNSKLLIADEPTASLDEKSQQEVIKIIKELNRKYGLTIIYITHDLGLIDNVADSLVVIKDGQIIETSDDIKNLKTDYAKDLFMAKEKTWFKNATGKSKLLEVNSLSKSFSGNKILDDINLDINQGEVLGIYGPSGQGKTTFVRCLTGLNYYDKGFIRVGSHPVYNRMQISPSFVQMIFQDAKASLNPRKKIFDLLMEPLALNKNVDHKEKTDLVNHFLELVSLSGHEDKTTESLSTGQCQRVAIARALISKPKLLICDEAVSAQDVLLQNQILDLLRSLQEKLDFTILLISHDKKMLFNYCDRVVKIENKKLVKQEGKNV
ncbi:MAG: ABC transporter ATP-binding protein [Pseudobutyrivibrio sp.]|nr:ABC transporter ATP-binding protein [Pseudobutyrivibrio sp.]